ncbi:MAG TPA: tail fiber domain-containing protein [bacterium]|nr:tail fiber domain-containing protein [bacterium]
MRIVPAVLCAVAGVLLQSTAAQSAAPTRMTIQGRLTDVLGAPLPAGPRNFLFRIYDDSSSGNPIWPAGGAEAQSIDCNAAGLWSAEIGAVAPLAEAVFAGENRWLEIDVEGYVLPRVRLVTSPYAQRVATVDSAMGGVLQSSLTIGRTHTVTGTHTFVAGDSNEVSGNFTTVAGGRHHIGASDHSTIGGGDSNWVFPGTPGAGHQTVGGGLYNLVFADGGTIGGGIHNAVWAPYAVVSGGAFNTSGGMASSVPGGYGCVAVGSYSLTAGRRAYAPLTGMFVWADAASDSLFPKPNDPNLIPGANFFCCRTTGGAFFATGIDSLGAITSSSWLPAGSGSWVAFSDKNAKHGFEPVDSDALLHKVAALPISEWSYNSQRDSVRHIGPMAQDFHAAFGVGEDERYISPIDEAGVALAAIQALTRRLAEKDSEIAELRSQLRDILRRLDERSATR